MQASVVVRKAALLTRLLLLPFPKFSFTVTTGSSDILISVRIAVVFGKPMLHSLAVSYGAIAVINRDGAIPIVSPGGSA